MPAQNDASLSRSLLAGAAGGLVGSWLMCALLNRSKSSAERARQTPETLSPQEGKASFRVFPKRLSLRDDTTVTVASLASEGIFGHRLTKKEKKLAGPLVHYAFGAGTGALYGALVRKFPALSHASGALFGALVWVAADEVVLPVTRLAKTPAELPVRRQLGMLGLHLAYGVSVDRIRRWAV